MSISRCVKLTGIGDVSLDIVKVIYSLLFQLHVSDLKVTWQSASTWLHETWRNLVMIANQLPLLILMCHLELQKLFPLMRQTKIRKCYLSLYTTLCVNLDWNRQQRNSEQISVTPLSLLLNVRPLELFLVLVVLSSRMIFFTSRAVDGILRMLLTIIKAIRSM